MVGVERVVVVGAVGFGEVCDVVFVVYGCCFGVDLV